MPPALDFLLLASIGLVGGLALLIMTEAFRLAPASMVAPFEYTGMVWAVVLGWVMFGDLPIPPVWAGCALVVGAGLYIVHRETRQARGR